jgi:hypothetical protein
VDVYGYCLDDPVNLVDPLGLEGEAAGKNWKKGLAGFGLSEIVGALPGDMGIVGKNALRGWGLTSPFGTPAGVAGTIAGGIYSFSQT